MARAARKRSSVVGRNTLLFIGAMSVLDLTGDLAYTALQRRLRAHPRPYKHRPAAHAADDMRMALVDHGARAAS